MITGNKLVRHSFCFVYPRDIQNISVVCSYGDQKWFAPGNDDWDEFTMIEGEPGLYVAVATFMKGRTLEYFFLVNGKRYLDPNAESVSYNYCDYSAITL